MDFRTYKMIRKIYIFAWKYRSKTYILDSPKSASEARHTMDVYHIATVLIPGHYPGTLIAHHFWISKTIRLDPIKKWIFRPHITQFALLYSHISSITKTEEFGMIFILVNCYPISNSTEYYHRTVSHWTYVYSGMVLIPTSVDRHCARPKDCHVFL